MPPPPDSWRTNVAAVIMDAAGNILLASPTPECKNWHFPQGGVGKKETLLAALKREVWEEVGLSPDSYEVICSIGGYRYRYKEQNIKSVRWKGQEQTYYLLLCKEVKPAIDIEKTPEFAVVQWVPYRKVNAEMFVAFKRPIIEQVLATFFPASLPIKQLQKYHGNQLTPARYRLKIGEKFSFCKTPANDCILFAGTKDAATTQIRDLLADISLFHRALSRQKKGRLLIIFDGMKGGGCSSSVRRLATCMNPFGLRVESFDQKDLIEMDEYDFLRPFSMRTPRLGQAVVFDHSLYDLLGKRYLRGEMSEEKLRLRMKHLSQFESMLCDEGTRIIKIYLHVSYEEQVRRIEKRRNDPSVRPEHIDFHIPSLEEWTHEKSIAEDMLNMGSKSERHAWYVIPSDRKWYRDLCMLRIVAKNLQAMMLDEQVEL